MPLMLVMAQDYCDEGLFVNGQYGCRCYISDLYTLCSVFENY